VTNQKLLAVSAACLLSLGAASINAWAAELGDLLVTGWLRTVVAWSAWSPAPKGFAASSSGSLARQAIRCRQPSPDDRNAEWSSSPAPTPVRRGYGRGSHYRSAWRQDVPGAALARAGQQVAPAGLYRCSAAGRDPGLAAIHRPHLHGMPVRARLKELASPESCEPQDTFEENVITTGNEAWVTC
jgi:hypothetical protein